MEISRPNTHEPTSAEQAELEKLRAAIERAEADGKLSAQEIAIIKQEIYADSKGVSEQFYRELELYRALVTQKLETGEITYDW